MDFKYEGIKDFMLRAKVKSNGCTMLKAQAKLDDWKGVKITPLVNLVGNNVDEASVSVDYSKDDVFKTKVQLTDGPSLHSVSSI